MGRFSRRRFFGYGAASGASFGLSNLFRRREQVDVGTGIGIFAYEIEGNDKPLSESAALARYAPDTFDLIVAQSYQLKTLWPKIKAANSSIVWAVYENATHSSNPPPYFAADWYVRDTSGNPVHAGGDWTGNFLMNPLSGWKAYRENFCADLVSSSGAPALYADELGVGPIYSVSAPPIDPRTDVVWTWADWMVEMNSILDGLNTKLSVPVYANGLGNGNRYFTAPTSTLLARAEGVLAESFIRGSSQPASFYPTATAWDREVRMLENGGPKVMACSKIWVSATTDVKARILRWCLGSFLLGAASGAMWYSTAQRATTVTPWRSEWTKAKRLGAPTAPRVGLQRQFAGGTVTVNNSTHDATITLI